LVVEKAQRGELDEVGFLSSAQMEPDRRCQSERAEPK
jgi:hypothetical protein